MRNTYLVARREFVENLRTKTFWLGILSLPLIFVIAIGLTKYFAGSKDVRRYAILDRSSDHWLTQAIDLEAAQGDFTKLQEELGSGADAGADFEDQILALPEDHPLREFLAICKRHGVEFAPGDEPLAVIQKMPAEAKRELLSWTMALADDPKRLGMLTSIASNLALSKYNRVPLDELEVAFDPDEQEAQLNAAINDGRLFAYFVIPADPIESDEGARYISNNQSDNELRDWFGRHATAVVRQQRIEDLDLSEDEAASIQASFVFESKKVDVYGDEADVTAQDRLEQYAPIAFVYLLWIAIMTATQMLLTNTVEEKSNRLIEVLLSSVSPMELMAGKVIGIAWSGLTVVLSWVLTAYIGAQFMPAAGPLDANTLIAVLTNPLFLASFIGYFLAGYLLFAAFLVALGSVCNSLKEAQNLQQPVFLVLMIPLFAMIPVVQDPNGTLAQVLTYIPLFTPFLMMNRVAGPPETWEDPATTALILVSLLISFWGAAKVFRVGILMTGKPPRIGEILRWLWLPTNVAQVSASTEPTVPPSDG